MTSIPAQKFREIVFQALYSLDMGQSIEEDLITLLMEEASVGRFDMEKAQKRVYAILAELPTIDSLIAKNSLSFDFKRINSVERNVLRLGVFELLYDKDLPPKVAISEAIRLCKKFGTRESLTFVNAILDNIHKGKTPFKEPLASP